MGASIDLTDAHPHVPIHLRDKFLRFEHNGGVFQSSSLLFGLATGHPRLFIGLVKEVKLMALSKGIRIQVYLDWLIRARSPKEAERTSQEMAFLVSSLG